MDDLMVWLTGDSNPAVSYRARIELLREKTDKQKVIDWVGKFLPYDWQEAKGLWYAYYLTAIAECGLTYEDIPINMDKAMLNCRDNMFGFGCEDFLYLRSMVMLGYAGEPKIQEIIGNLKSHQLPDGGFLCLQKHKKLSHIPKSCVKSNNAALMLCSECRKRGIKIDITNDLIEYFRNHRMFYKTSDLSSLMLNAREGWRTIDTFYPFETMRVGLQNIVEAFCALGYGNDEMLKDAWHILDGKKDENGMVILDGTLTKSYLPKERVGKPSKWVTFYTLLSEKERIFSE